MESYSSVFEPYSDVLYPYSGVFINENRVFETRFSAWFFQFTNRDLKTRFLSSNSSFRLTKFFNICFYLEKKFEEIADRKNNLWIKHVWSYIDSYCYSIFFSND